MDDIETILAIFKSQNAAVGDHTHTQFKHKAQKEVSDHDVDAFMSLKMIKDELSVNSDENVILRDTRVVFVMLCG